MADVMTMTMPMTMEDITSKASRLNIDLSSIDWNSIRVPPDEDFGIISYFGVYCDMFEEEELLEQGFGNVIIVDNIPVVSREKFDKLEGVLRRLFSRFGVIKENGLWIPVEEGTGRTRGYCFIEFNTAQEAELAKEKTDKCRFDRAHVFAVNMFDDIEKFSRVPDGHLRQLHHTHQGDDEDIFEEEELLEEGFGNVIIVDNIPVVSRKNFDKLEGVLRMIFSQCGVIKDNGLWIPVEEGTGRTRGYCFVEFNTAQEAELAKEKTDKYKLGKKHVYVFSVNMFDDIEKLSRVPDEWAPPATTSYTAGVGILV